MSSPWLICVRLWINSRMESKLILGSKGAEVEVPLQASEHFDLWIEAGRTEKNYWRDLWRYRELFYFLAWRDILVRYKQTVIGVAWALIRPFITMMIFTVV